MFAVLRDYFASRRRMRQYSGDFFAGACAVICYRRSAREKVNAGG